MELVRQTIENVVDQYKNESQENFIFPSPSKEDIYMISPLFKNEDISPAAAYLVLLNFDRDPKNLSTIDLENRVKVLKVIYNLLDNQDFIANIIAKNMDDPNDPTAIKNAEGMVKVLKRIVNLLIMESNLAHFNVDENQQTPVRKMYDKKMDRMRSYTSYSFIFILAVMIMFLCFMINNKK